MSDPKPRPEDRNASEIGAAEWLFQEPAPPRSNERGEAVITPRSGAIEEFEVLGVSEPDTAPEGSPVAPERPAGPRLAAGRSPTPPTLGPEAAGESGAGSASRSRMVAPETPAVEQVWSRASEWGQTLAVLAAWLVAVLFLAYLTLGAEWYAFTALLLAFGGLGAVLLSYPILITLERPVRITPEQAARDFFSALSHHLPHHRRMWLLLSTRGRVSPQFASFEGFRNYWKGRLQQLREGHAGQYVPLSFQVGEFQAEKSAGKTEIDARFRLRVFVRGRRDQGPIWSLVLRRSFVRGPDGMWYMNDGTLSDRTPEA